MPSLTEKPTPKYPFSVLLTLIIYFALWLRGISVRLTKLKHMFEGPTRSTFVRFDSILLSS
jgi:hypothetical protein